MNIGYSGTPVLKKLGIKPPMRLLVLDAPPDYSAIIGELPPGVCLGQGPNKFIDMVHLFATSRSSLSHSLAALRHELRDDAAVWVSWPKKAAKVPTDITEDTIRELALPLGFVDIKVCAVSAIWSGLKLVVRKELRGGAA